MAWMKGLTLLVAAATLGATAAGAQTLRIGLNDDPDLLDPTLGRIYTGRIVLTSLCDRLFDITPDIKIIPQLATSYEWGPDQKSITVKLRPGLVFHNGEKVDAEAVKYTIQRGLTLPGSFRKSEIGLVTGVDVIDELTARINLSAPYVPLLAQLTDRAAMLLPPKATEAAGDKFANNPICAGPYKFVERVAQDRIVLEKFDRYWNPEPYSIKRVVFISVPDTTVRVASLQSGSLDLIERVSPTDLAKVRADPNLRLLSADELGYQMLVINLEHGPRSQTPFAKDPRVREAFEASIDRKTIIDVVFNGDYVMGNQFVPPSSRYYNKDLPVPGRDLAKAKALLKAAGAPNPTIRVLVPNNPDLKQAAQVMQAMSAEAGFDMQIQVSENAAAFTATKKGDFEALLTFWSGRIDPSANSYSFLTCGGAQNDGNYCNKEVDSLLGQAQSSTDEDAAAKLYHQAEAIVLRDRPYLYLWHRKWFTSLTKKVNGFTAYPDGLIRLGGVTLTP